MSFYGSSATSGRIMAGRSIAIIKQGAQVDWAMSFVSAVAGSAGAIPAPLVDIDSTSMSN